MTHVILIRHGQIQANVDKRWHGWTDSALTTIGKDQAQRVADRIAQEHPDIKAIYASPLQRTFHTAQCIADALNLAITPEPRIREYGIGILEGERFKDLHQIHGFFSKVDADPHYAPDQGESISQVGERVKSALLELSQKHQGEKILAVSHGAAMALALAGLLDQDWYAWGKYQFGNTSVTEIKLGEAPNLIRFNCSEHLTG